MRLLESDDRLTLHDTARAVRILGGVFVMSGLFVLSVPWTMHDWGTLGFWPRVAVLTIGLGHLAGGLVSIMQPAASRVELDRASGEGVLHWLAEWRRVRAVGDPAPETRFHLADVRTVEIVKERDSDGEPTFRLRLWLADGRQLPLQAHAVNDAARVTAWAERVRTFVGLPALHGGP